MKLNLHVEFGEHKVSAKQMEDTFKEMWKESGGKIKDIKELDFYYKPEEHTCYYVVNKSEESGKITF